MVSARDPVARSARSRRRTPRSARTCSSTTTCSTASARSSTATAAASSRATTCTSRSASSSTTSSTATSTPTPPRATPRTGTSTPLDRAQALYPVSSTIDEVVEAAGGRGSLTNEKLKEEILSDAHLAYDQREEALGAEVMRELERRVVLSVIDRKWREHLYEMDYLKEGIGLRAMAQRDPLVEYQREGFDMFGHDERPSRRSRSASSSTSRSRSTAGRGGPAVEPVHVCRCSARWLPRRRTPWPTTRPPEEPAAGRCAQRVEVARPGCGGHGRCRGRRGSR